MRSSRVGRCGIGDGRGGNFRSRHGGDFGGSRDGCRIDSRRFDNSGRSCDSGGFGRGDSGSHSRGGSRRGHDLAELSFQNLHGFGEANHLLGVLTEEQKRLPRRATEAGMKAVDADRIDAVTISGVTSAPVTTGLSRAADESCGGGENQSGEELAVHDVFPGLAGVGCFCVLKSHIRPS